MTSMLAAAPRATSVLICDDRPIARRVLAGLLSPDRIVAVADGFAAADAYAAAPADVVFVGVHSSSRAGVDALNLLLGLRTATVIAFGSVADGDLLIDTASRGACGLMIWDPMDQTRSHPFRTSATGKYLRSTGELDCTAGLSEREYLILHAMSRGMSNSAIGRDLSLAEDTIKSHARQLFGKLGARDRAHAVAIGMRRGLLR